MFDPMTMSAIELASRIRKGSLSSLSVVETHIRRIEKVNPRLNAMVADRFEQAREEARSVDEQVRAGLPKNVELPLLGVPFTVKEAIALESMPHSAGLPARRNVTAEKDAVVVSRLRKAGAIPLGVTNTSELCMWMESNNKVYGRTNNPYDTSRTAGGSSGGEGALVGAGCAPFGVGADIGGSIRMPAFFCGVFGLKPTGGRVPNEGAYPLPHGKAAPYYCNGPLARRAEDLLLLLAVMDGSNTPMAPLPIDKMRVLRVADRAGPRRVVPALKQALNHAAGALSARGARVVHASFPDMSRSLEIWTLMLAVNSDDSFAEMLGVNRLPKLAGEFARLPFGRSHHTFPALGLSAIEKILPTKGPWAEEVLEAGSRLRRELTEKLGDDGVLLYPPHPVLAPKHNRPLLFPVNWVYTAVFNVMEVPVVQVPLGLDPSSGLPLGVQVIASHGREDLAVSAALALEEAMGGHVPPP